MHEVKWLAGGPGAVVRAATVVALAVVIGTVAAACATEEAGPAGDGEPVVEQADIGAPVEPVATAVAAGQEQGAITQGGSALVAESGVPDGVASFVVDPERSEASYLATEEFFSGAVERLGKALGMVEPMGVAGGVQGNVDLVLVGTPQVTGGELVVDLRGLASDDERRDRRIREEWLESDSYPEAVFTITGAEGLPATFTEGEEIQFTLLGDLTVRGVTQPVSWQTVVTIDGNTLTGTATTEINMSDFGVQPPNLANMFKVEDGLSLSVKLVATRNPS